MFENIKNKVKDIYYNIYTRRYMRARQKNTNENAISADVLPEEVKYKILQKGLILEPKEEVYAMIASLYSEEHRNEMIEKYISINNETLIEEILKIPEILRTQCLKNNQLIQFAGNDVVKLLKSTTNANMYQLLLRNPSIVDYLNKKTTFYYSKYTTIEEQLWYYLYQRISQIEDNELKTVINQLINIEDLAKKIDTTIVSNEELAIQNIDLLIDEHSKSDLLLKIFKKREHQTIFLKKYRELSEEVQQQILSKLFSAEYVEQLEEIYEDQIKQKKYREIDFGELLQQYSFKEKIDQELLMKLFRINRDDDWRGVAKGRKEILSLLEDENKAKILCDGANFSNISGVTAGFDEQLKLFSQIENKEIFANALDIFIKSFKKEYGFDFPTVIMEDYLANIEDKERLAIIQNQSLLDDKNMLLFAKSLFHIQSNNYIKEALKCELIGKEDLNKRKDEEQAKNKEIIKDIILFKISQYGNTDELLTETNIGEISDEIVFTLLLNASEEVVEKYLKSHKDINYNIQYIFNNKFEEIKKLTSEIDNKVALKDFLKQLLQEELEKLDNKLEILLSFQERHSEIAITAKLSMLEENIINAFGGINNLEMLLRYPKTQKHLLNMNEEELKSVGFLYNVLKEKLHNPNYLLDEMLEENGKNYSSVCRVVSSFLSEGRDISEEEKEDIINILLSNDIIERTGELRRDFEVKTYKQIKAKYCDSIINGENDDERLDITEAYLLRYYNLSKKEAEVKVKEYEKFIDRLDNTEENIPIKNYIIALKNVLASNPEILSIAYQLSKGEEEISRLDIEIMEEQIRERAGRELKETLFKTKQKETSDTIQVVLEDNEVEVSIYEPSEEFNMLVHVLDAYGGGNGEYLDYEKQWNTNKYARNQRICASYIGNNNMAMVKRHNCVIYGFDYYADTAFVKEAPYDIVSKNNDLITTSSRDALYLMPRDLINTTRRYNEVDIEREDLDKTGQKLQPSYIVCFGKSKEDIEEESKRAAAQFGIPIVLIDREKYAERELQKIEGKLKKFEATGDPQLISEIIEEYCNNKVGSRTTIKDRKDSENLQGMEVEDLEEIYFSDEKLKHIINRFLAVADKEKILGNIETAESINQALKVVMKSENEKDYLWQEKFGVEYKRGVFDKEIFEEETKKIGLYESKEDIHIQSLIQQIENEATQEECKKQKKQLPDNLYDIDDLKEKIDNLSSEEKEYLEQKEQYWYVHNFTLEKKMKKIYTLLLGKDLKLKKISSKVLSECIMVADEEQLKEKFSEEEVNLIQALKDIGYGIGEQKYQSLINEYHIPEELQEEFIKAKNILYDAHRLACIAASNEKKHADTRYYETEEAKRYIKTALQIQESEAVKKINTIIAQEGYENQREIILSYLKKGRTPIELAQTLHEVNKKEKIKETNDNGER